MRFCLFGVRGGDLVETAQVLGSKLGVDFERRESSYKGGDYFLGRGVAQGEVTVELNWMDEEDCLAEPKFPEYSVLIYVNEAEESLVSEISRVESFTLLRSEDL